MTMEQPDCQKQKINKTSITPVGDMKLQGELYAPNAA